MLCSLLHFSLHLQLPAYYFNRVVYVFEEAEMSTAEQVHLPETRIGAAWDHLIDSLIREWETLNVVSVLLLS